jgi:uncharacterized protein (DUF362 family)/Pyruvate/2-oxoacid:ferredoxin oxidoreductase delta subunit
MKTRVSLIKCSSYEQGELKRAVRRAVDLIGGMAKFVKSGEKILLKPNLLAARQPDRAITTHPEVMRAMVRLVREAGAVPFIGDSPGGAIRGVERVWIETGMKAVSEQENVKLINFETAGVVEKSIDHPGIKTIHVSKYALEIDGIINMPKLKTHSLEIFTGAVKNLYGCIPGLRKGEYHMRAPHSDDFGVLLGEIYLLLKNKIRFTLIDGIYGMEGNGPSSGEIRKLEMILAGSDGAALDTAIVHLLGFKPDNIETIKYLRKHNGGETAISNIEIAGDSADNFKLSGFKFPSNWHINMIPHFLINILGKFVWVKPMIVPELCTGCLMCVDSCPVNAIRKNGKGGKPEVEAAKCISCLCCHELCPCKSIELDKSFLAKRVFRA